MPTKRRRHHYAKEYQFWLRKVASAKSLKGGGRIVPATPRIQSATKKFKSPDGVEYAIVPRQGEEQGKGEGRRTKAKTVVRKGWPQQYESAVNRFLDLNNLEDIKKTLKETGDMRDTFGWEQMLLLNLRGSAPEDTPLVQDIRNVINREQAWPSYTIVDGRKVPSVIKELQQLDQNSIVTFNNSVDYKNYVVSVEELIKGIKTIENGKDYPLFFSLHTIPNQKVKILAIHNGGVPDHAFSVVISPESNYLYSKNPRVSITDIKGLT